MTTNSPHDSDVTFHQHAEREAKAAAEAIQASLSEAWRRDLHALRGEFDARLAAFQPAVGDSDAATAIERLVDELSGAATRQAEEAAAWARSEAKQAADEQLARTQATAQSQLEQARAHQASLLQRIETLQAQTQVATSVARAEVHAIRTELTAAQNDAVAAHQEAQERTARLATEADERTALAASLEAAHQAITVARAETEASQADNVSLRRAIEAFHEQLREATVAQIEAQAVRAELTATVEDARVRHTTLSALLAAAQQDVATAQQEVQERTIRFETTEEHLQAVETAYGCVQAALADSEAQLVAEARDRAVLVSALKAARQTATVASTDVTASRAELAEATAHLAALQQQLAAQRLDATPLARLRRSLQAFAGLTQTRDVLVTFLEQLEPAFDRVALFVVRENRVEGWQSVGFEPTTDVSNLIIPFTVDSPLTSAASGRTSIMIDGRTDEPTPGLLGHETYGAMAIPIATEQGRVAIAYVELARRLQPENRLIRLQMAEILAEHVMGVLTHLQRSSAPAAVASGVKAADTEQSMAASTSRTAPTIAVAYPGPARAAERVRMFDRVEVVIDGAAAQLVDISSLGAQVTCARTIRPNRQVRIVIPQEGQNTLCCGHVMWALFEVAPEGGRYRAGLKFTSVDTTAVEAFLSQRVAHQQRTSA